jgi:uncharacterized protein YjbJ (UPF0337 family)
MTAAAFCMRAAMPIESGQGKRISELVPRLDRFPAKRPRWRTGTNQRRFLMNWNEMEGNWEQFKGKVQTQWGKLTNDDLSVIKGRRRELAGKIQERYGKAQEDAEREVDEWYSRLN